MYVIVVSLVVGGCSTYTAIDPVGKGRVRLNGSVGGPFFSNFDAPIPMPYIMGGLSYGLEENMNLTANVHLFPIPFGVTGADVSFAWFPVLNDSAFIPTVSIQPTLSVLFTMNSNNLVQDRFAVYPYISGAVSWKLWIGTIYAGLDVAVNASLLPPYRHRFDSESPIVFFSPFIGYRWNISQKVKLVSELKFHAVNARTDNLAVDYITMLSYGTIAPYLGVQIEF